MHPSAIDAFVSRLDPRAWLGAGAAVAIASVAATALVAPIAGDAALAVLAGLGVLGGVAGFVRGRALTRLPLEIADRALGGEVDAVPVVRLRARLGRGRVLRDARARVWVLGDGAPHELVARVPGGVLVGPFTVVALDPDRRLRAGGRLRVEVAVTAGGGPWTAVRELAGPVAAGRFGGVVVGARGVELVAGWDDVDPTGAGTAC